MGGGQKTEVDVPNIITHDNFSESVWVFWPWGVKFPIFPLTFAVAFKTLAVPSQCVICKVMCIILRVFILLSETHLYKKLHINLCLCPTVHPYTHACTCIKMFT